MATYVLNEETKKAMREDLLRTEPSPGGTYCLFTEQSNEELMATLNRSGAMFALLKIPEEDAMRLVKEDRERFEAAENARKKERKPSVRVFYAPGNDNTGRFKGWHWRITWPSGDVWKNWGDAPKATREIALKRVCCEVRRGRKFGRLFKYPRPKPKSVTHLV
ncbi:MAG: hypothetical protein NXH70_02145 [Hyphomonas sp.]|nr:hypothetical protein [Hyphomonas sp.]